LTDDEVVVLDPIFRDVHHPYSDKPQEGISVLCYPFEEVFAEKIRALAERARPRDLYDVIHLYRHDELQSDQVSVVQVLERKCEFKGIPVPTMQYIEDHESRPELDAEWANMLGHQLPALPQLETFWKELPDLFAWLHRSRPRETMPVIGIPPAIGRVAIDETWQPPAMIHAWNVTAPMEKIRFAAANRLCVDLAYQGSKRLIEPYSLRRTSEGNILLFAVRHRSGEPRSYRVDRIQGAEISQESFNPRYAVELSPAGPISAPPLPSRAGMSSPRRRTRTSTRDAYGPKYVFECTYCGRKFTRKSTNSSMKPHKDKSGYPCPGRRGYLVDTKY